MTVQLQRAGLPTFFSRIWGNSGNSVSATATAEAFNPSNSGNVGNAITGSDHPGSAALRKTVDHTEPGSATPSPERVRLLRSKWQWFTWMVHDVGKHNGRIDFTSWDLTQRRDRRTILVGARLYPHRKRMHYSSQPPPRQLLDPSRSTWLQLPPSVEYLPGEAPVTAPVAVPSCAAGSHYEQAVGGCDQSTVYQCGVQSSSASTPNLVDLNVNPGAGTNDTMNGVTCLIHEGDATDAQPDGQDTLQVSPYPFQVLAGTSNPLLASGLASGSPITSSTSIVSLPIYDSNASSGAIAGSGTTPVTIVGFLQVFINSVDQWGNMDVTVLNVAGCSNGASGTVGNPVTGSSPVPIRLITPP